ncbi:MAG: CHAT domain protein [Chloroflexi bacterium ADurb.Bin222]|nr:MAG: CHAT domain protein [Chloroflexi bacterium ADurb.Bin222]
MDYRNMDLELFDYSKKRNVERFRVRVESSPTLDMKISEALEVRIPRGFRDRLSALEGRSLTSAEITEVGKTLGKMLFPGTLADAVVANLNEVGGDLGLRIRLKLDSFTLADLPWEYVWLQQLQPVGFLALNGRISLVRYEQLSGVKTDFLPLGEDSVRLAALLADPQGSVDYRPLNLDVEETKIRDVLSKVSGLAAEFQSQTTVDGLNKALALRPHILHFAGHGKFEKTEGEEFRSFEGKGYLVLLDEQRHAQEFPVEKLVANLQGCGVRLAVLGACESARRDGANAWTGIGPALAQIGIPAVIGMQYGIRNTNATTFSEHFYHALAVGESVDWAMNRARLAIHNKLTDPDERDWGVPVLYLRMRVEETEAVIFRRLAQADRIAPPRQDIGVISSSVTGSHICPSCNAVVAAGKKFCENCGAKFCPQCRAVVSPTARFCGSCGTAQAGV